MKLLMRIYRVRGIIFLIAVAVCVLGALGQFLPRGWALAPLILVLSFCGLGGVMLVLLTVLFGARSLPAREPITVASPLTGRWLGLNSPVDQVPSHGVRAYGQAYAIDLVCEPPDQERPAAESRPVMRRPEEYPAFGEPVRAMVGGTVVSVADALRDHRARAGVLGVLYLMVEGAVRELGGPRFVIGNHVTIRSDDGDFALVAHLKRGSVLVRVGDRVQAGAVIGACGNSGNSSEPHVHAQLMDRRSVWTGQGIPIAFADVRIGTSGHSESALPGNFEHMIVERSLSAVAQEPVAGGD